MESYPLIKFFLLKRFRKNANKSVYQIYNLDKELLMIEDDILTGAFEKKNINNRTP